MIMVNLLEGQELLLAGQECAGHLLFGPVQDVNGGWFISTEEQQQCVNPEFMWVKDLPEAEYIPPIIELPI